MNTGVHSLEISFEDIIQLQANQEIPIHETLIKIYSNFLFNYFNWQNTINDENQKNIIDSLNEHKFATIKISSFKESNFNLVICLEKVCILIISISKNSILNIIKQIKSSLIIIHSDLPEVQQSTEDSLARSEVDSFYTKFTKAIESNKFIKFTIHPVLSYLIRRFFYPTDFFKDPSFFSFQLSESKKNAFKDENNDTTPNKFLCEKIIPLRCIKSGNSTSLKLVFYLDSLYIFVMKSVSSAPSVSNNFLTNEINYFKENCSSKYLVKCYGYYKTSYNTICFLYDYMSNGSLYEYMEKRKSTISYFFSFTAILQIFIGLHYLHSKLLIHRDLKPSNILIDHDFICHIADFETVRTIRKEKDEEMTMSFASECNSSPEQIEGPENLISFPTDIFSFGYLIYFVFEHKNIFDANEINIIIDSIKQNKFPLISGIPESIQSIYRKCLSYEPTHRPTLEEIKNILFDDSNLFYFLDQYFIEKGEKLINDQELNRFIDNYNELLNSFCQKDISQILYKNGSLYCSGEIVKKDYKKSAVYYKLSAKFNNPDALNSLGNLYFYGLGVEKNLEMSRKYYEKAAKQNHSKALYALGYLYENGFGIEIDYLKAKGYYQLSANLNHSESIYALGKMYYYGNGVEQSFFYAKQYFELSAKKDNHNAHCFLGYMHLMGEGIPIDYKEALKYFELSASKNDSNAQSSLGYMYEYGLGVEKDYEKAKYYYELSIDQNNSTALFNLGNMYFNGKGVQLNYEIARNYIELSAEQNYSDALNTLGLMYDKGYGVDKNYPKAKEYFLSSIKLGNQLAQCNLGDMYFEGKIDAVDYVQARKYYELSARQNNAESLFNLANLYTNGYGVVKNYETAIKYYEKACQLNHSNAMFALGKIYYDGKFINQDYKKAKHYFSLASLLKHSEALLFLGEIYFKGLGVEKNILLSYQYYLLSAQYSNLDALFYLGYFFEANKEIKQDFKKSIEYYLQSLEKDKSKYFFEYNSGSIEKFQYNHFYYQAANNLGLIYLIEKEFYDIKLADKYISIAGYNEYSFGENNKGLFSQYIQNDLIKAEYFYKKAAKKQFDLAEFNVGYLLETQGKIDESLHHYQNSLKFENEPLIFHYRIIIDERLKITRIFINSMARLKIIDNYLSHHELLIYEKEIKSELIKVIFRLLFKLIISTDDGSFLFTISKPYFIKELILGCPLFNLKNFESSANLWKISGPKASKNIIFITNKFKVIKKSKTPNKYFMKKESEMSFHNSDFQINVESVFRDLNEDNRFQISTKNCNDHIFYNIRDNNNEKILVYPKNFEKMLFINFEELKSEIKDLISQMSNVLHEDNHRVLFGRFPINDLKKTQTIPDINQTFYDGFSNN